MQHMKKIFFLLATLIMSIPSLMGQQSICLGNDITVCTPASLTINDCANYGTGPFITTTPYVQEAIPYNPEPFNVGTSINLSDDAVSPVVQIGFNFCFFGIDYSSLYIGSNGWVSFSPGQPATFTSDVIPNTGASVPKNCIMAPWQDFHPGVGPNVGNYIKYQVLGTAPNRRFVVSYNEIPFFSCTGVYNSVQIILYESTNLIETHIQNKNSCTWAGGTATHGVHDPTGTIAFVVPGRNSTQWTVANEGRRFTPGIQLEWENTLGQTFPYNGGQLVIPSVVNDTVGYYLTSITCNEPTTASDTSWVIGASVNVNITASSDDFCSQGIGEATATPVGGVPPYTYSWNDPNNQAGQTATNLFQGNYTVTITDGNGCQATATVAIGDSPISLNTTYTQVSCPAGNDGTATVQIVPAPTSATYDWYDAGNQNTATATGLTAGTYNVAVETALGCQDTATVVVDEIPGMLVSLTSSNDVTCNSGSDGQAVIQVTQGTSPYTYQWNTSGETTASASGLVAGINTVTVVDANGCTVDFDVDLDEPNPLQFTSVSTDTVVCVGDSVLLYATGNGGSSTYTYTWTNNGNVVGTGDTIYVTPTTTNTSYCVTLTEQCGSPQTQECMTITYPEEIVPMILPDNTGACYPVEVNFENVTNTTEIIDYTVWSYGDGDVDTIQGNNGANHSYDVGLFDVTVEVVSDRGCSYSETFNSLIEGYDYPEASFYANPNPASVFEPEVDIFSQSSGDVITFQWFAEGAEPNFSTLENPTFQYPNEVDNYPVILVVENGNGCRDSVERLIRIQNEVLIFAPNSFTPDSDGANDKWRVYIQGIDVSSFHLELFNRWGEVVFESFDPEGSWDGSYGGMGIVKDGTYIWTITARDVENDNKYEFKGFVNVLK
jgi:gliding motility-associated-like protein